MPPGFFTRYAGLSLKSTSFHQSGILTFSCRLYRFTLRKRHAQIVNIQIYCFTGRFSGTMEFNILRFYRFTARLGKRRALDLRLAHRHHSRMEQIRKTHMPKQPPKMVHVQLRAPMFTFERFHKGSTLLISGSWSWQCQCNKGSGTAIIRCSGSNSHSRELPGHGTHGRDTRQGPRSGPGPGNLGCGAISQAGEFWLNFHQKLVISPHEKEGLTAEMGQMGLGLAPVSCFSHQDSW